DRYFLNKVVNKVFELNDRHIEAYSGNYDAYVRQRRERFEHRLKTYEAQREEIERQEEYIRRVGYSRATLAQSRQKQLDKIERLERPTMIEARLALGHLGTERQRQDDAVAHSARRGNRRYRSGPDRSSREIRLLRPAF